MRHDPHAIIDGIRRADADAHLNLYRMTESVVRARYQCFAGDHEDAIHDTYIAAVEAISAGRIRRPEALFHWVCTVAYRNGVQQLRAVTRARANENTPDALPSASDPEAEAIRGEVIGRALAAAHGNDLLILHMHLAGYKRSEIAARCGLTGTQERINKSRLLSRVARAARRAA